MDNLSVTRASAMPARGVATFNGPANINVDPVIFNSQGNFRDDDDLTVAGDTKICANFATGQMKGEIPNLVGVKNLSLNGGCVVPTSGSVTLGGQGKEIGVRAANTFDMDYDGALRTNGGCYRVNGKIFGDFKGNRTGENALRIIGLRGGGDGNVCINGNNANSSSSSSVGIFGRANR